MKKSKFTDSIMEALKRAETGVAVTELCRELGVSSATFYKWLSQYYWEDLDKVRLFATQWMYHYNHYRPNMALGGFTPKQRLAMAA